MESIHWNSIYAHHQLIGEVFKTQLAAAPIQKIHVFPH